VNTSGSHTNPNLEEEQCKQWRSKGGSWGPRAPGGTSKVAALR